MNRLVLVSLAGISMLALAACGESEQKKETPPATSEQPAAPAEPAPAPAEPAPAPADLPLLQQRRPNRHLLLRRQLNLRLLLQNRRPRRPNPLLRLPC